MRCLPLLCSAKAPMASKAWLVWLGLIVVFFVHHGLQHFAITDEAVQALPE